MSIYTDSGVTLFRAPPHCVLHGDHLLRGWTNGNAVMVDGVPITGSSAVMPTQSGSSRASRELRDTTTVAYQNQLDQIAGGLIRPSPKPTRPAAAPPHPRPVHLSGRPGDADRGPDRARG